MRYIYDNVIRDLRRKMVFIGGPRQCGKTTLARAICAALDGQYLNWDDPRHRHIINKIAFSKSTSLVVFDELHKKARWKSWIKGIFDTRTPPQNYLVTGSAMLDLFRRGGDSLMGRYHYWRLHPFTLDEHGEQPLRPAECLRRLMTVGGFPEPFLEGDEAYARRWRKDRMQRLLRDDVRDLSGVRDLALMESLVDALTERVGGPIVYSNLAEALQVAPKTIKAWVELLERLYIGFLIRPYTKKVNRSVQKAAKMYFFDNMDVTVSEDRQIGARFENLVATHLLKRLHYLEDSTGHRYELCYLRDKDKREVDFVIVKDKRVDELIEVKYADSEPSTALRYFQSRLQPRKATQIVYELEHRMTYKGVDIMSVTDYFGPGCYGEADPD